ncbi:ABC-2 type transport system permease protein [Kitasatospora sp. GP30]|uniref:ABC transporter permease subunit n=1 Tax=Kitasatospora sp. GP30 TaxID=3035084 RepID=UPI000CAD93D2|nr:ABC transporter permease [Kitasatospora sp. GP30]MDH6144039.1 ABC-2 type transport system permease protein [Kitasatospora sp. GP30]
MTTPISTARAEAAHAEAANAEAASAEAAERRARWRDLLGSEWIKLWSLRSTGLVLGCLIVMYVYLAYKGAVSAYDAWPAMADWMKADWDLAHDAFDMPTFLLLQATVGTVGAMTVSGEYASGLIRTSLTAVPDRNRVMLAKVAVVAGVLAAVGLVLSTLIWAVTFMVFSDRIPSYSFSNPGVWRGILATTLMVPVCGLIGTALAALIRNTAGTVFAVLAFFLVGPVAVKGHVPLLGTDLRNHIADALPPYAWFRLCDMSHGRVVGHLQSVPAAWSALIGWGVVSVAVVVLMQRRRDV